APKARPEGHTPSLTRCTTSAFRQPRMYALLIADRAVAAGTPAASSVVAIRSSSIESCRWMRAASNASRFADRVLVIGKAVSRWGSHQCSRPAPFLLDAYSGRRAPPCSDGARELH